MAALSDPVADAIFNAMERLSDAGYEFEDITAFGWWLLDYVDNHPEDGARVMEMANAYIGRLSWVV